MKFRLSGAAGAVHAGGWRLVRTSLLALSVLYSAMVAVGPTAPAAVAAEATSPEQLVAGFHATLVRAMKIADNYQARYDTLAPVMSRTFDFDTMTRIAVGPRWNDLRPEQQAALVDAFRRFSIATYASQFDGYSGERFDAAGPSETAPQGIIVATMMKPADGKAIRFNYLLHRTSAGWRIIDIYLEGTISQLAVRRSEFTSVLAQSGPDGLAQLLDQKTKRLAMM